MNKIENDIKVWRAKANLTQAQLAAKAGVTRQTIIAVEKGKYIPSLELAFKLAQIFGQKVEDIFKFEEKNNEK